MGLEKYLERQGRQAVPYIIFLDEVDSIAPHRGALEGDSK